MKDKKKMKISTWNVGTLTKELSKRRELAEALKRK